MRRIVSMLLIGLLVTAALPTASDASDDIVITGSGWGHGVGLSQYGAKGMAASGASAAQILGHYYSGTSVGSINSSTVRPWVVSEARPLWVGVMQNETTVTFKPVGGGATVCFESGGTTDCLPAAAGSGELWRFKVVGGSTCTYEQQVGGAWVARGEPGPCNGAVTPNGSAQISFVYLGRTYRDGVLRLRKDPDGAGVHAVWQTALEPYVRGIAEVPSSWPAAALQAQAIAARSYAVSRIGWRGSATAFSDSRKAACWCNLYATTWDQQFLGVAAEASSWVSAVNATAGRIVVSGGRSAETFYSSSSGGRTESNQHYWGSGAISYLQGVDDSAAHTAAAGNPHSAWSVRLAPSTVASKLGFSTVTRMRVLERYPSGSASRVEIVGTKGGQAVVTYKTGKDLRSLFGLRSQYLTVDWAAPSGAPTTTAPAPTTTTTAAPAATTVPSTTVPDETSSTVPADGSTTVPDETTSTEAPSTTQAPPATEAPPVVDTPIEVDTPDGPGTGEPAPITNRAPEPKGAAEPVAPPPPPAPEPIPIDEDRQEALVAMDVPIDPESFGWPVPPSTIPWDFGSGGTPAPATEAAGLPETIEPAAPAEAPAPPAPSTEAASEPRPEGLRKAAYEAAAELGAWVARLSNRIVSAAGS